MILVGVPGDPFEIDGGDPQMAAMSDIKINIFFIIPGVH